MAARQNFSHAPVLNGNDGTNRRASFKPPMNLARARIPISAGILLLAVPAGACEPILPFMKVVTGPAALAGSLAALAGAVALKTVAFACLQKKIGFFRGLLFMFLGNILTTLVGLIVAAMLGNGAFLFLGAPVVWALAFLPAKRLVAARPLPVLAGLGPGFVATLMTLALMLSAILFMLVQGGTFLDRLILHWSVKLAATYLGLIVSIILTAFWEEWTIWRLSASPKQEHCFVRPVLLSNLLVLFCVMLFAAAIMIPSRLKSRDFLAKLAHASISQKM
jgi:hypothetical protein